MAYLGARKRTTRQASSQAVNRRRSEGGPRAWFASIDWNSVRFRTVAVLFFVVWGALWVRAVYVQLWEGPFLAERARRQHMAAETVAMPRGMITDRNGHILARSVECCSVYANPSIITDIEATATTLAGVLGRPVDQIKPGTDALLGSFHSWIFQCGDGWMIIFRNVLTICSCHTIILRHSFAAVNNCSAGAYSQSIRNRINTGKIHSRFQKLTGTVITIQVCFQILHSRTGNPQQEYVSHLCSLTDPGIPQP